MADLVLCANAESKVAAAVACRLKPAGGTSAHLEGTLAGLRALTGDLGTVQVTAKDVRRAGTTVDVSAALDGVTTAGITRGGSATAVVDYTQLGRKLGMTVTSDGQGLVFIPSTGLLPVTVHTRLATDPGHLTVTPTDVTVLGRDLPADALRARFGDRLAPRTIALPGLPSGVTLSGATADADGLQLMFHIAPMKRPRAASCR